MDTLPADAVIPSQIEREVTLLEVSGRMWEIFGALRKQLIGSTRCVPVVDPTPESTRDGIELDLTGADGKPVWVSV